MSAQLEQLLGYLERDGVTEVVIGAGKPIAMRNDRGLTNITARPLTTEQLASMVRGTRIAALIPEHDGDVEPSEVQVGRRRAMVRIGKRGDVVYLSLTRVEGKPPLATQPIAKVATPADAPRTDGPPSALHATAPTSSPVAKSPAPRTTSVEPASRTATMTTPARFVLPASPAASPAAASDPTAPPARPHNAFDSISLDDGIELGGGGAASAPTTSASTSAPTMPSSLASAAATSNAAPSVRFSSPRAPATKEAAMHAQARTAHADFALELDGGPSSGSSLGQDARMVPPGEMSFEVDMGTNPPSAPLAIDNGPLVSSSRATTSKLPPGPVAQTAQTTGHPGLDLGFSLELDDIDAAPAVETPGRMHRSPLSGAPPVSRPSPLAGMPPASSAAHSSSLAVAATIAAPARAPVLASATAARVESGDFARIVDAARNRGASDLHIAAARVTSIRVNGDLVPLDPSSPPLAPAAAEALLLPLLDPALRAQLDDAGYIDLALDLPAGGRLRANISRQQQGLKGTFRLALAAPATLEQLGLPADVAKVVGHHQGLVIIAGPSGHGKTTTLAALVDLLNSSRAFHILTIEDPVEIIHTRKQAVISQRETGRHTASFARGLKASLREDPDVIVIGELRDRESVEIALTAAETGHLVIATMSTPSAAKTLDRLIDMFPPEDHSQVRASVAGALRAIVAQRLLPKRGGGIVPAIELVTGVLPLAVMIREDKLYQLPNLMQRGRAFGMIRFDESLAELVRSGRVDEEAALAVAESKKDLAAVLQPQAATPPPPKTSQLWGFGKKENR